MRKALLVSGGFACLVALMASQGAIAKSRSSSAQAPIDVERRSFLDPGTKVIPGSTNRYETSYGIRQKTEIDNPTLVKLRDMRLKYMFEEMRKDPAVKLQLASYYASVANYWKFFDGEKKQLLKYLKLMHSLQRGN